MGVYTTTRVYCSNCNYEYPNDYYFGIKQWCEAMSSEDDELHFCSEKCINEYHTFNPDILTLDVKPIEDIDGYLRNYKSK